MVAAFRAFEQGGQLADLFCRSYHSKEAGCHNWTFRMASLRKSRVDETYYRRFENYFKIITMQNRMHDFKHKHIHLFRSFIDRWIVPYFRAIFLKSKLTQ